MVVGRRWFFLFGGFANFPGANSLLNFGGGYQRLLISTDHCSWKKSWCDHQVRAKHQSIQSVAESNTASQGNLLWWCHPCGLQFPEMWSGNLWCPNLPQNEQLEFKNYQQKLFSLRRQVSAAAMFDETTFNLSQNETPRCTPLRKMAHQVENAMLNMLNVEKDWVGISGYHGISSASAEVTQNIQKTCVERSEKGVFFSNRSPDQEPKMCQIVKPPTKNQGMRSHLRRHWAPGVCYRFPYVVLYAKNKHSQKNRKASGNRTLVSWWLDLQCWEGNKMVSFHLPKRFLRQLERHFNWVRNMAQCFPAILLWC